MTRSHSPVVLFLVAWCFFGIGGCAWQINAEFKGHGVVEEYPKTDPLHPNRWARYPTDRPGPHLAVYVAMGEKFEENAKTWTEHLYYEMLPCSQTTNDFALWVGPVYAATDEETSRYGPPEGPDTLIKVIVPLTLSSLIVSTRMDGLEVGPYIDQARTDGLCIRIGGGRRSGIGLLSDVIRIPARIVGDAIVIDELSDTRGETHRDN